MSAEHPSTTRKCKAPLRDSSVDSGLIGNNGRIRTTVINKEKSKNNGKRYREEVLDPDSIRTHTPTTPPQDIIDKYWDKYTIANIDSIIRAHGQTPPSGDKVVKISHLFDLEKKAGKFSIDGIDREDEDTSEVGQHLTDEEIISRAPVPAASILNAFTSKPAHTTPSSTSTASSPIVIPGDDEHPGEIDVPKDAELSNANKDVPAGPAPTLGLEVMVKSILEQLGDFNSLHREDMSRINEQFARIEEKIQGQRREQEQEGASGTRASHSIPDSYVYPIAGHLLREAVRELLREDAKVQVSLHGFQITSEAKKDRQIKDRVDVLLGELGNSDEGAACLFHNTKQVNDLSYEFRKKVCEAVTIRILEGDSDQLYAFCQIWDKSEDERCVAFMKETNLPKPFQPGQYYLLKTGAKKTSVLLSLSKMVADKYAALEEARQKVRRAALRQAQQIDEIEE
eukprot:TRINITY_DN6008_c0_g1_i1.p1 TRINITY_DN6008_c0_g1~~TRINITY_DN6008_c0_g1_i1.p1  ORF type:complete len:479 (+),score=92.13 TRINITY_DN6008_c0_g1_i1:76-1437(+)